MRRTLRGAGLAQLRGQRLELAAGVVRRVARVGERGARRLGLRFRAVQRAPRLVQPLLGARDGPLALVDRLAQPGRALLGGGDEPLELGALGGLALARLAVLGVTLGRLAPARGAFPAG